MRRLLLPLVLLALTACGREEPPAAAPAPAEEEAVVAHQFSAAITEADYAAHVETLASDEFEGRAPGSRGERLTTAYLSEHFGRIGLAPGNRGEWFQAVPMVEITRPEESSLLLRQGDEEVVLAANTEVVLGSTRPVERIGIDDSAMVFVGYGIVAPEYGWNDYEGLDVTGKTVVVLVNDPGFATQDPELFRGNTMTYYGRWTYKYEEAARQGAAAALIIHETAAASYPWEVVFNSWTGPQFDLPDGDNAPPRLDIQGWISGEAAAAMFARAGHDLSALMEQASTRAFRAVDLDTTASASIGQRVRTASSNNVIGVLPGSEAPEEYVLFMAHWDHLGRVFGRPGSEGIFNGAIDNATGVAALLELAEAFAAGERPRRSLVFAAVTLEESGLLGSRWYAENPLYPLETTAAVINMDAMTVVGPTRDVVVVGYGNSELEDYLKEAAAAQNRIVVQEEHPERGYYYRSDHFNFAKAGVPALYAKGGTDHIEKGQEYGQAIQADYNQNRYHKPSDIFDPEWDLRGVIQDIELLKTVAGRIANESRWPNWYEGTEFRAVREQSADARQ
ncbi:MAG TPA: M28 family metallopeptidase [Xanthomonadaceae bacterium]|nr:M28 family metallopeptidase [Xanthomonadaceae bacterium]